MWKTSYDHFQFGDSGSQVISALLFRLRFLASSLKIFHCSDLKKSLVDVIGDSERSSVVYGCEHHKSTIVK